MDLQPVIDAHVHFWDPAALRYPWLDGLPALQRAFLPADYTAAAGEAAVEKIVFVECNCRPTENIAEVGYVTRLAQADPRLGGIVAYVDLTDPDALDRSLDALADFPMVKGVRHNIQGEPRGFAVQRSYVEGVRKVGRRGLTVDLCITYDQLEELVTLVAQCPDTHLVLDHCGKPTVRERVHEPWKTGLARFASFENTSCKVSGLLTEADPEHRRDEHLIPYVSHVVESFGMERVMYGSDWPVLTLAGTYADWFGFARRFSEGWAPGERQGFFSANAARVYGL